MFFAMTFQNDIFDVVNDGKKRKTFVFALEVPKRPFMIWSFSVIPTFLESSSEVPF